MARAVGQRLWPRFGADLRAARVELEERQRAFRAAPSRAANALLAGDLEARLERGGWCLCVVAAALGSDLLGARREARGLEWIVAATAEAAGVELQPNAALLPDLPVHPASVELALLAAWCALEAGARRSVVRWSALDGGAGLAFALDEEAAELQERCARVRAPDTRGPRLAVVARRLELGWS
jgi:hypothetical protein